MVQIKRGLRFKSKWIENGNAIINVLDVDTQNNKLSVRITPQEEGRTSWVDDDWNLQHTIWGFEKGEYTVFVRKVEPSEVEDWREKAMKWDALEEKISKFYEEDAEGDLTDIGEVAASAFGFMN